MKNYKLYISTIFTLFFLGAWSNLANADACDADGTAAAPMTPAGCDTAPDIYKIMVFEMGLCKTVPTLANRATACTSVSSIPAGTVITVAKGTDSAIPGAFTRPVNGSYTHGYVILAPEFRLTATKTFSSNLTGQSNTAGDTCWTLAGSTRDSNVATAYDGATPTVIGAQATWLADCGTAASAAPAETIIIQDAFGGDTIESGNADATAQATVNGVTIKAHLTDDTMAANATTSAAVTRLVGFVTFATPVAITDKTSTFTSSFRTTQGMELDPTGGGDLKKMSSGPFVLNISVN
jgi:hypothetical protein|tara:strand:+ start:1562 stop:2443 length:882 start_codon:yes stop_codon:yes gene_type:complete